MKLPVLQRNISNRALAWLCVAVLLVSLMPLYALSFYNHACYDDFGFSLLTRAAWQETGSVLATVGAAVDNTKGIRNTWEGTYATSFISALQPALFGENLYWVSTLVLLTFFLFALWFFLRQVLVVVLHVDKPTFRMALCALAFVMIQFVPEMSEAFFWFNGGVAYTLLWSATLLRLGAWIAYLHAQRAVKKVILGILLILLTLTAGGAKYSTVLFAVLVDALIVLYGLIKKRRGRFFELAVFVLLLSCFVFSMVAPGNTVRAATLHGGVNAPKAILQAFYFGLALVGSWFSLPLLVVWAMVAWQLAESLRGSPYRFNHPVWVTLLSVCLFCAQLAPTLYTGNYIGDGRTINTYFYTFVLMSCALVLYWMGWYIRRAETRATGFAAIGTAKKDGLRIGIFAVAVVLLIIGCLSYQPEDREVSGIQNMSSGSALRSLLNGEAQAYDEAMDARDAALNDPDQPEVVLKPVEDIPDAFMGDALESDNLNYVLDLYADYYNKQRVSVAEEE
ncbi:MAG: hypothetical protein IJ354_07010 [Clostridia bacterium]|nr:hypothetical protein [Clostridia bacterium]